MISTETIVELERQRLIERSGDRSAIRLTHSGSRQMHAFPDGNDLPAMNRSRTTGAPAFRARARRPKGGPRPLV